MRIQHYLSIIFGVSILGAIGLAIAVGTLLGGLEQAARQSGRAADQYDEVKRIVAQGGILMDNINQLTTRSSQESYATVDQALEECTVRLVQLRHMPLALDTGTVDRAFAALERTRQLAINRAEGVRDPDELEVFRTSAAGYVAALGEVDAGAAFLAGTEGRLVAQRRRVIMLIICVLCFLYLALIERVRHWTTRRLITPLRELADAAHKVMDSAGKKHRLEPGDAGELATLTRMLESYTESMDANVQQRTAQMERQMEALETEVRVRRRAMQELRYGALHDRLTGLCSRELLLDRIERCLVRARRGDGYDFAVLIVALDQYTQTSEQYGHVGGDLLLVAAAERFTKCLAALEGKTKIIETTLSRAGGDAFAVLLDGITGRGDADQVSAALQSSLGKLTVLDKKIDVSASVGITFNDAEVDTAGDLLRNADAALCYARAVGDGKHCVFNQSMHRRSAARIEKAARLRNALEEGHFDVVYQPIVCLSSGRLQGFEALARWSDPKRGPISPVEFIVEAEETGIIVQLGRWVMTEACRQLQAWRGELHGSRELTVSVNVSKLQLCHRGLLSEVSEVLEATGIDARSLKLEITESVIVESSESVLEVLRKLKTLGVEIHMDDFGTGYSSLSYLHQLPIDVLKIDRAFMSTLSEHHDYADVVHTVVALARTLNLKVTVEGIESEDQVTRVTALDCDFGQGFYFSKPLSAEAAAKLIASNRRWYQSAA